MVNVGGTVSLILFPTPLAVQLAPPAAAQVHVTPLTLADKTPLTTAPPAALGPRLWAATVYVTVSAPRI
jgi:hypothetical protein